jgi:hypothetical protein
MARACAVLIFTACAFATPLGGRAVGRACADSSVHIAVVVDAGPSGTVSTVCVAAGSRDNGAAALAARASRLGTPQPRYNGSGLLCAIDGIPQTGCGDRSNGHYSYWSYWHGAGGNWSYSNVGPGGSRVNANVVEGWRWQPDGAGLPTDPAPRGPATPAAVCAPAPPPTTRPPTTTPPPTQHATAPPASSGGGPGTVAGQQVTTTTPAPGGTKGSARPTVTTRLPAGATKATTGRAHASSTTTSVSGSESSTTVFLTHGGIAAPGAKHSSGGLPVGLVTGVVLVIALGAGGAVAARRRSRVAA